MPGLIEELRKVIGRYETDRYPNNVSSYSLVPLREQPSHALTYRDAKGSYQNQAGNKEIVVRTDQTTFTDMPFADRLLQSYVTGPLYTGKHNKGYKIKVKRKETRGKKKAGDTITTQITMRIEPL